MLPGYLHKHTLNFISLKRHRQLKDRVNKYRNIPAIFFREGRDNQGQYDIHWQSDACAVDLRPDCTSSKRHGHRDGH